MTNLKRLIAKHLRDIADKMDAGTTDISESAAIDIFGIIFHEEMSKEQACSYLNLSRSRFDDLVRENKIPRGQKRVGFKELVWWKDELEQCKNSKRFNV